MSATPRPRRTSTGVRFDPDLHARLVQAASERGLSANYLVNVAIADFLDRLIPVEEIRWTRPAAPPAATAPADAPPVFDATIRT